MDEKQWDGDHPFYLLIAVEQGLVEVDLDERGWIASLGEIMHAQGTWHLVRKKDGAVAFSMAVLDGEQPYYVARHVGMVGAGGGKEITCYGIGKKRVDGKVDRIWAMPNGQIVLGDEVELFARGIINGG